MYEGMRMTTRANAMSRPWMSSTVTGSPPRARSRSAVDHAVEGEAARRLDEDGVAVAQARPEDLERILVVGDVMDPRRVHAGRRGAVRDAAGIVADDDEEVGDAGRRRPDRDVTGLVPLAELQHLAEHRHVPAREAGEEVQGREHGARGCVVAVVDDRGAAQAHDLRAVRGTPAGPRGR